MISERESIHPSNYQFHLISTSRKDFDLAFQILFHDHKIAKGWKVEKEWLHLVWHEESRGMQKFPFNGGLAFCADFCWNWLKDQKPAEPSPDVDGSINEDAYEIESTDHIGWEYGICKVRRVWAIYAK